MKLEIDNFNKDWMIWLDEFYSKTIKTMKYNEVSLKINLILTLILRKQHLSVGLVNLVCGFNGFSGF